MEGFDRSNKKAKRRKTGAARACKHVIGCLDNSQHFVPATWEGFPAHDVLISGNLSINLELI